MYLFQGPPGLPGLPGEPGSEGIGIPGPKVCVIFCFFLFVVAFLCAEIANFMSISG